MPPPSSPQNYHVGWICAVQTYVVACEILDEEYSTLLASLPHDNNTYTFGRIGDHKVVIACLPKGKYGLTSAASVAKDMLRSFPSIRVGMVIGIGGGAPSLEHEIRLGDVVVSSPVGRTGGVIYYEFGKTIQNQKFERTGTLNTPPLILLAALNMIEALHERKGHQIAESVSGIIERNPRLRKKYQHPPPETDRLYKSSFIHPDPDHTCEKVCGAETAQLIQRNERTAYEDNPSVHYGLIASADRLMKDAQARDTLARDEGVLCFEMEAAGLIDHFPCVVIRGIDNYSDTHKNDIWEGYAAATAAAYAKELLNVIPAAEKHSPAETAVTDRFPRPPQRPRHHEEKGNMEVLWPGKKRRSEKDARTCKRPRTNSKFQHTAAALEPYIVRNNGEEAYYIKPKRQDIPEWQNLVSLSTVVSAGENYSINDVVYILLQGGKSDSIARIRHIRDLGGGRKVICVLWYYSRDEMRNIDCANMSLWPEDCSYMLSTQLQVLMWDTMNGKVEQKELEAVVAEKVVDVCAKLCRIIDQNDRSIEWLFKSR
jgi:nucleoside phosphorylase